jgi:hypothetical protein
MPINYNLSIDLQFRFLKKVALVIIFKFLLVILIINMVSGMDHIDILNRYYHRHFRSPEG